MMARWLTVLIALVAQGMALMSPVCFVRCIGPNGHECVELTGQGCHCCDCRLQERSPDACVVASCGHHHDDEDQVEHEEQVAPAGWQVHCEHCSCQHLPLESSPQVQSKSVVSDDLSHALDFVTAPATLDFVAVVRTLENVSLRSPLLRPHESPHLTVVATVVLRV